MSVTTEHRVGTWPAPHPPALSRSWLLVGVVASALVLARVSLPGTPFQWIYAEDAIFLADARRDGITAFWSTYGGYAHLVPRLLSAAGSHLPLEWYAMWTWVTSASVIGLAAGFIAAAAERLGAARRWAAVAGLALPLAPVLRWEGLASTANLQFFLIPAVAWALLLPGRSRLTAVGAAFGAMTALSSVLVIVPLAICGLRQRTRAFWATLSGFAAQVVLVVAAPSSHESVMLDRMPGESPILLAGWWLNGVSGASTLHIPRPERGLPEEWVGGLAGLLVLTIGGLLLTRARSDYAWRLVSCSAVVYVGASLITGYPATRYQALGAMLLVSGLAFVARGQLGAVLAGVLAASALLAFPAGWVQRFQSPMPWGQQVERVHAECAEDRRSVIEPYPVGWATIHIDC